MSGDPLDVFDIIAQDAKGLIWRGASAGFEAAKAKAVASRIQSQVRQ